MAIGGTTTANLEQVFTSVELVVPTASTGLGGVIVSLGGFADPSSPGYTGPQATSSSNETNFDGVTVSGLGTRIKAFAGMSTWIGGVCLMIMGVWVL